MRHFLNSTVYRDGAPLRLGDLVCVDDLETGIVVEPGYITSHVMGEHAGILMSDAFTIDEIEIKRCHLISRSPGSPYHVTPFPGERTQDKSPQVTKFSSQSFQELSTLTIDEDIYT